MSSAISPLCEFASWFPQVVEHELEGGRRERHQFRETTWTDQLLFGLRKLRDPRILVRSSNEVVTGADMDWWFVKDDFSRHIRLTVQAKILHYLASNGANWAYPELRHPHGFHGRQSRQLTQYASKESSAGTATYPIYLFYNPRLTGSPAELWCDHSSGVTIANGYRIARHLDRHRMKNSIPISATRLSAVGSFMSCLPSLLCAGAGSVPDPDDIVEALGDTDEEVRGAFEPNLGRLGRPPEAGDGVPYDIRALIDRMQSVKGDPEDGDDWKLTRNTVVFLGGEKPLG